jgi:hypothetical protein
MIENKTYSAADFERYHNGSMPAYEMHALEKAALEDPFLADALDGYAYSSSISGDISQLRSRLNEKRETKNESLFFAFKKNGWLRIAALLAIIAGGSYIYYQINYKNKDKAVNNFALHRSQDSSRQKHNLAIRADTNANNITFENAASSKPAQKKKIIVPRIKSVRKSKTFFADTSSEPSQTVASINMLQDKFHARSLANETLKNENENKVLKKHLFKGTVTDDEGSPLPFATITEKGTRNATTADASGNFTLQTNDSVTNAVVTATGYEQKQTVLANDKPTVIAVDRNASELSTVVVTAYGLRKNKLKKSKVNDRDNFNKYLKENITPLYDSNNVRLAGKVSLSFTLDKERKPENIKVIQSSCNACEHAAINLLKNGPQWHKEKNALRNVVIRF